MSGDTDTAKLLSRNRLPASMNSVVVVATRHYCLFGKFGNIF